MSEIEFLPQSVQIGSFVCLKKLGFGATSRVYLGQFIQQSGSLPSPLQPPLKKYANIPKISIVNTLMSQMTLGSKSTSNEQKEPKEEAE